MSDAERGDRAQKEELDRRIQEVDDALHELRADLQAYRAALEHELRTEKLVIRTRDGFARIVLATDESTGQITVHARSGSEAVSVELFANDRDVGGRAHTGLALTEAGNVVSVLELLEGEGADLWIASDGDHPAAG